MWYNIGIIGKASLKMNDTKLLQNLHTHTTYCDGADTPEEMVLCAIEKGFDSLGFSCHSPMFYSDYRVLPPESVLLYQEEVNRLKVKYRDKLEIYCGLEYDMYCQVEQSGYDYLIGAVHYLKLGEEYVGFDRSAEVVKRVIDTYFDGDGMRYAKAYYEALAELPSYGKFDIIGHFDLICKYSENVQFFDEKSKEYRGYVLQAADALRGRIPLFEVNTGAIARGYRTSPYPTMDIIKILKDMGFGVCISSDCHDAQKLDCHFAESAELLRACGLREKFVLTNQGFVPVAL